MESSEASWHSFDPSVAAEDSEAMARLLGVQFFGNEQQQQQKQPATAAPAPSSMYWPGHEADQYYSSAPYYIQMQEGTSAGAGYHSHGYYDGGATVGEFFVAPDEQMADPAGFMVDLNLQFDDQDDGGETSGCKRKLGDQNGGGSSAGTAPRKKARPASAATPPPVQRKGKSSAQPRRGSKGACSRGIQEESNGGEANNNVQSSSNYPSDDNEESLDMASCSNMSSASKKTSSSRGDGGGGAKARAGRGAATDPQSLYARKRREKINERLKVLQSLVPNGTKVDISTMLEEAVHYIKFMQLQIKLLSSDDMWMFAPLAYNGFNVGLDLKIAPPQP